MNCHYLCEEHEKTKKRLQEFFNHAYSDDFKGGAIAIYSNGFRHRKIFKTTKEAVRYAAWSITKTGEAYATLNQFRNTNTKYFRKKHNLWAMDHVVIDLDIIDTQSTSLSIDELISLLTFQDKYGELPLPSGILESGSGGYHLYYSFERLPKSAMKSVQAVKQKLIEQCVWLEDDRGFRNLRVDIQTMDASRLFRLPGSIHSDSHEIAKYRILKPEKYSFRELEQSSIQLKSWNYKYLMENSERSIFSARNGLIQRKKTVCYGIKTPEYLAQKRINELMTLADSGYSFVQCRERACFILRNNAFVLCWNEKEILDALQRLNEKFYAPLSERELRRSCRVRRHYKMRNMTIRSLLNLGPDYERFFSGEPTRELKHRKERSAMHKRCIAQLVLAGKKIIEIAKELQLSISLVKRRRAEMARNEGFAFYAQLA